MFLYRKTSDFKLKPPPTVEYGILSKRTPLRNDMSWLDDMS